MPELPEVETVRQTLEPLLSNLKIVSCDVRVNRLVTDDIPTFVNQIVGKTIKNMSRRGKYLIFVLNEGVMVSHLRMEGKFFIKQPGVSHNKHEHVIFTLSSGQELRYHDVRKFGTFCFREGDYLTQPPLAKLGKEPFDSSLTGSYLMNKAKNKTTSLKAFLLDQTIIAGLGNIYVDEVCFRLKKHPSTSVNSLKNASFDALVTHVKDVMQKAIALGGTTIRSYVSIEGVHGRFQNELDVHMQAGKPCGVCQSKIEKTQVAGRGTYFCPVCQKAKR